MVDSIKNQKSPYQKRKPHFFLPLKFFCILIVLWFIDIMVLGLTGKMWLQTLFCFYIFSIFHERTPIKIFIFLIFLALESFIQVGGFGLNFIYLIPFTVLFFNFNTFFVPSFLFKTFLLITYILFQSYSLEPFFLTNYHSPFFYTGIQIFVNVIVLALITKKLTTGR